MGFERCDLLTEEADRVWKKRLWEDMPGEDLSRLADRVDLWELVDITIDPERPMGTVNLIARDSQGNLCAGVSTSGWAWSYPGRVGDSPIVLYADNRYGAAACTGMGEMAIRASTAHSLVFYLRTGFSLADAGRQAMEDLNALGGPYLSRMNLIALGRDGSHAGFSSAEDEMYVYITDAMDEPQELPRTCIRIPQRWR
jgi:beta-aspartyl-peptidase (threonine type)